MHRTVLAGVAVCMLVKPGGDCMPAGLLVGEASAHYCMTNNEKDNMLHTIHTKVDINIKPQ